MKFSKEINKYTSLIIVLSVLLAISLVTGATFAWFASSEREVTTVTLGDPVVVNITEKTDGTILPDGAELPFTINNVRLMPGMQIKTYASVKFQESKTPALLRVKLNIAVESSGATTTEIAELVNSLNNQIIEKALKFDTEKYSLPLWVLDTSSGWWYYTGGKSLDNDDLQNTLVEHINCETGPIVDFLNPYSKGQNLIFPTEVDNKFSGSKITFWFSVQAIQAKIPVSEDDTTGEYMVTTIRNVESVFNEAFAGNESNKEFPST